MNNNIRIEDNKSVISFLKTNPKLTAGQKVIEFEKKWSKWLGVKYSVFVNSGSSANIATMAYLKTIYNSGEIIVPSLTWVSDITSVLYAGFKVVFVDINLKNLGASIQSIKKAINKDTRAVFITHILGFNALTSELINILKKKNIDLIEDVCESHGATYKNKKLGTFGKISNFSFYFAHHMTTIEGGMICTNDRSVYNSLRIIRGHGMLRESIDEKFKQQVTKKNKFLNDQFLFYLPGYNFRSTEINAVYGIKQLKRLNNNNLKRIKNFQFFLDNLDKNKFVTDFDLKGSCNYALIIIFREKYRNKKFRVKFENLMLKKKIEFRRGLSGGGNQFMQPYLKFYKNKIKKVGKLKNTNLVHNYGYYIGNYPGLSKTKIIEICRIINSIN